MTTDEVKWEWCCERSDQMEYATDERGREIVLLTCAVCNKVHQSVHVGNGNFEYIGSVALK